MLRFITPGSIAAFALLNASAAQFSRDIAPILMAECLTCHNAEKAKGGYRVHTFGSVMQPGKSKSPAVVPNKPEESELYKRLLIHDEDDRMPQDDAPLTAAQIQLIHDWIFAGATLDQGDTNSNLALLLPRVSHPEPPQIYPRALPILSLAFTPDGKRVAVGGYHEITFWSLDGELEDRVTNVCQRIHSISFDPGGDQFAMAGGKPGRGGEVSIYKEGSLLTNLLRSADEMLTVAFSPERHLLAAGGSDNSIHLFSTTNWQKISIIQQHADWVTSVAFNSAGTKIASASRDRTARIYSADSGELETTYPSHNAAVFSAIFIDNNLIASGGRERIVHLWEPAEGKKKHEISGADADINEIVAGKDSLFVVADKSVRQYASGDRKLIRTFSGHSTTVYSIAWHPGSDRLASGSYDGAVKIWNVKEGTLEFSFVAAPLSHNTAALTNAPSSSLR